MTKEILYIDNGENVDAAWTGHIVISNDGINWDSINKAGLSVGKHYISINNTAPNSHPERGERSGFVITLKGSDEKSPKISFDASKVTNQPTWVVPGAASDAAGALQAMSDIMTWIS